MKKLIIAIFSLAVVLLLGGCWMKSMDELYKLPQQSEEYLQLQNLIEEVLASGAEYASPTSGSNRQSVQLIDLNGDGVQEAVAFFKMTGDTSTVKPLKIYIFERTDSGYKVASILEGDGTGIESIDYTDLTGDGSTDIIVGWKISTELRMLGVYSMNNYEAALLATTDYSDYELFDMTGNGRDELMVVHYGASENESTLEMYSFNSSGEAIIETAQLSQGLESIDSVKTGYLESNRPALLVEGLYSENSVITDVFTCVGKKLTNITLNDSGISTSTVRNYAVYSTDIDNDGIIEIPAMHYLNIKEEQPSVWLLQWYTYSVTGRQVSRVSKCSTYHNYTDGWYLEIPDEWLDSITVRREDRDTAEKVIIFSIWNGEGEEPTDFLAIYTLTGSNRDMRASIKGRVTIKDDGDTIYALKLLAEDSEWRYMPSETDITERFHVIQTGWIVG